jgi:hypothetical protein
LQQAVGSKSKPWRQAVVGLGVLIAALAFAAPSASAQDHGGTVAAAPTPTPAPKAKVKAKKVKKPTIRQIQRALGIKADGKMGPKTRRAIKRFQRRHGLKVDGIPGTATLRALGLLPVPRTLDLVPPTGDVAEILARIAECESGGNPEAVSPDGRFRGKYQFSQATWEAYGGVGDPIEADEATQDAVAALLYAERGLKPWPTCGARVRAEDD